MGTKDDPSIQAEREVGLINSFFPILPGLGNRWAASRPWEGLTIGVNMHLTTLTAALLRELTLGGGTFVASACSTATVHQSAVQLLRNAGVEVYTGGDMENRHLQLLEHKPDLLVDVGFELIDTLLEKRPDLVGRVRGAIEVTRNGITKLRSHRQIPFPVVNINDGRLKDAVENRHGVGQAIWGSVAQLTRMHLAGRRAVIIGYGSVGKGLALYGRSSGMTVEVVEVDPVRRLFAHYDGFATPPLDVAIARANVLVSATGKAKVVCYEDLLKAKDGLVLVNAGHGGDEFDIAGIKSHALREDHIAEQVVRYRMGETQRLTVLGGGHPLNIVLNSGSPEPVLLHFAVLGLVLQRLVTEKMPTGEVIVPDEVETEAAILALESLASSGA